MSRNRQKYILALDQGTTSSRAIVLDHDGRPISMAQQEFPQILPAPGIVEHDPEAIWQSQLTVARKALAQAGIEAAQVAGLGIANQRETTVLWDRTTGRPVANAIVWQSRASLEVCQRLKQAGHEPLFRQRTGLLLDPYFSGTKVTYLLQRDPALRQQADQGNILFGTVDSFLIWRLTKGSLHVADISNASRTLLLDLDTGQWDDQLRAILEIPEPMLPRIVPSSAVYGHTDPEWFGAPIPIAGCAGDQQAALFGQTCFRAGMAKNTYGTGCFLLLNTGDRPVHSESNLLASVAWQLGNRITYCLEGSIFMGGAVVQWLRDGLHLIAQSDQIESLAATVPDSGGVYLVPGFVGLGAPHWDPTATGLLIGISRGTTAGHLARAALESMAYQSRDILVAMQKDAAISLNVLKVDGGASVNDLLMQFQADILGVPVERPQVVQTTALGAAYLAGLAVEYWRDLDDLNQHAAIDRQFVPQMNARDRERCCHLWGKAVSRAMRWSGEDA